MKKSNDYDLLRLDNQLCFALYAAARAMTRTYWECLQPLGLTYPQFLVLIVLWEKDNLCISQLGEALMLDSGTLTPLLRRLESLGYVRRQPGTADRREVRVSLTTAGQRLQHGALTAVNSVRCRLRMADDDMLVLRAELMRLIGHLENECHKEAAE